MASARFVSISLLGSILLASVSVLAEESQQGLDQHRLPNLLLWGDTHLHTSWSGDAFRMGTTVPPESAYRFARGETVESSDGTQVTITRPLDFLVVADHARHLFGIKAMKNGTLPRGVPPGGIPSRWRQVCANADRFDAPGRFTTFSGFEWTPSKPRVHRVVIFADTADKACQLPFFSGDTSNNVEDLWSWLEEYENTTGGRVMAISHGANQSRGTQFAMRDYEGKDLDRDYAETRSRWEPLYEVTQTKGDTETHPLLSPDDEFADHYRWPVDDWEAKWETTYDKTAEYARSALKSGLGLRQTLGVNPFKVGLIGSTDMHSGLATLGEDNFQGNSAVQEPGPERVTAAYDAAVLKGGFYAASGLAAVWTTENTRDAIFAALQRREVYATTGSRILLQFFAGYDYGEIDVLSSNFSEQGHQGGVPMGGDLGPSPAGESPVFLIRAARDPQGANLDRIQVVKGWLDGSGHLHEQIYNVAVSDNRTVDGNGNVSPVGNTISTDGTSYSNRIGDPELTAVWHDPHFNNRELAFYYVRVLEIPTPQWPAFDRLRYDLKDLQEDIPMMARERAYSSPIWYSP